MNIGNITIPVCTAYMWHLLLWNLCSTGEKKEKKKHFLGLSASHYTERSVFCQEESTSFCVLVITPCCCRATIRWCTGQGMQENGQEPFYMCVDWCKMHTILLRWLCGLWAFIISHTLYCLCWVIPGNIAVCFHSKGFSGLVLDATCSEIAQNRGRTKTKVKWCWYSSHSLS